MCGRRMGASQAKRDFLGAWWRLYEHGYRGPMPYVIGPGWKPPPQKPKIVMDEPRGSG